MDYKDYKKLLIGILKDINRECDKLKPKGVDLSSIKITVVKTKDQYAKNYGLYNDIFTVSNSIRQSGADLSKIRLIKKS